MVISQRQLFLYGGVGLALSGIVTILLVYQSLEPPTGSNQENIGDEVSDQFRMEEVHANPNLVMHIHVLLEVNAGAQQLEVPREIGISRDLWHDHSLDEFGPSRGLLAPMHTHDASGTIHIESVVLRNYTLGEFISIWGFDEARITKVTTSDGSPLANYMDHILTRNQKLIMTVGP